MMYDELVKQLQYCATHDCMHEGEELVGCTAPIEEREGCCTCNDVLMMQAADAIEALCAKATPKRVGFAGWKGCRDTRYKCPYCNKYVRNDETYCHKCGQALMFPRISHTPYVPGEKQEVIVTWPDEPPKEE